MPSRWRVNADLTPAQEKARPKVAAVLLLAATLAACTTSSGIRMRTGSVGIDAHGCATAAYVRSHPGDCSPH